MDDRYRDPDSFRVLSDAEFNQLTAEQRTDYLKRAVQAVARLTRQLQSLLRDQD